MGVGDRKECEFRGRTEWRTGGGSCYTHGWNVRIWICVPLNETCRLCARNDVLIRLRAAEDLRGAVCLFSGLRYSIVKLFVSGSKVRTLMLMVGFCVSKRGICLVSTG